MFCPLLFSFFLFRFCSFFAICECVHVVCHVSRPRCFDCLLPVRPQARELDLDRFAGRGRRSQARCAGGGPGEPHCGGGHARAFGAGLCTGLTTRPSAARVRTRIACAHDDVTRARSSVQEASQCTIFTLVIERRTCIQVWSRPRARRRVCGSRPGMRGAVWPQRERSRCRHCDPGHELYGNDTAAQTATYNNVHPTDLGTPARFPAPSSPATVVLGPFPPALAHRLLF